VWLGGRPDELPDLPDPVRWVQLPSAGVEQWVRSGKVDGERAWTSATGGLGLAPADRPRQLGQLRGDARERDESVRALERRELAAALADRRFQVGAIARRDVDAGWLGHGSWCYPPCRAGRPARC